jgi:GcrA cell cycle regulator
MTSPSTPAPGAASVPACPAADARNGWSDPAVERLKQLWADRDLSAAAIARHLGVSRNAVLGKVHRLGLSNRRRGPEPRAPRPERVPKAPRTKRPPVPGQQAARRPSSARAPVVADVGPCLVAHLEDIPRHGCHWPVGDPHAEDFRFCGRRVNAAPYCDAHRKVAYRPGGARPADGVLKRARS